MRGSRSLVAAAVGGLLIAPSLGACSTTVARPAAPPSSSVASPLPEEHTLRSFDPVEGRLTDLATEIDQDRDEADIPGYGGLSIESEQSALDLWWVGIPPERVQRLVAAPPEGLVIRLHPAAYDVAAMSRAVERLMDRYPVLHAASPEPDGSGVEVETTTKGERSLPDEERLAEQAGMPVHVIISEPPEPA